MKTKHTIVVTVEVEEGKPVEGRDLNALLHEETCTVEYKGTDPKEIDAAGVEALLTELPRTLVGDGKTPNIFFVTNEITGKVVAVFLGDDKEEAAIAFADSRSEPLMVEDRLTGVVHDNVAGEQLQDRCRRAEEGEHFDRCPNCHSDNIANHDAPEDGQLPVTCHECSYQWTESTGDAGPAHTPDHPEADDGRGPAHTPDH